MSRALILWPVVFMHNMRKIHRFLFIHVMAAIAGGKCFGKSGKMFDPALFAFKTG